MPDFLEETNFSMKIINCYSNNIFSGLSRNKSEFSGDFDVSYANINPNELRTNELRIASCTKQNYSQLPPAKRATPNEENRNSKGNSILIQFTTGKLNFINNLWRNPQPAGGVQCCWLNILPAITGIAVKSERVESHLMLYCLLRN